MSCILACHIGHRCLPLQDISAYRHLSGPASKEISHNIPYADLSLPVVGPQRSGGNAVDTSKNHWLGSFEESVVDDHVFKTQERTFRSFRYAVDPAALEGGGRGFVGDVTRAAASGGADVFDRGAGNAVRKRKERGDPGQVDSYQGPWAGFEGENENAMPAGPTAEEWEAAEAAGTIPEHLRRKRKEDDEEDEEGGGESTIFHGKEERDYQGRTYMHVPRDLGIDLTGDPGQQECFLPKRVIHTWWVLGSAT